MTHWRKKSYGPPPEWFPAAGWRKRCRVHPAADVFPMMSEEELLSLAKDIRENGLREKVTFNDDHLLIDGRNRMAACEMAGYVVAEKDIRRVYLDDPVPFIVSANIRRRHLSSAEIADALVALARKTYRRGEVSLGGRGKKNPIKEKALEANEALPKDVQVGKRTIERAMARAEGKTPAARSDVGLEAARRRYLNQCAGPGVDLDAEMDMIVAALKEIAGNRIKERGSPTKAMAAWNGGARQ